MYSWQISYQESWIKTSTLHLDCVSFTAWFTFNLIFTCNCCISIPSVACDYCCHCPTMITARMLFVAHFVLCLIWLFWINTGVGRILFCLSWFDCTSNTFFNVCIDLGGIRLLCKFLPTRKLSSTNRRYQMSVSRRYWFFMLSSVPVLFCLKGN